MKKIRMNVPNGSAPRIADRSAQPTMMRKWPECEEFNGLMQAYRHAPLTRQDQVVEAYEAVKLWIRNSIARAEAAIRAHEGK